MRPIAGQPATQSPYQLTTGVLLNGSKTTLVFSLHNDSPTTHEMAYPDVNNSPIAIVTPRGKVIEYVVEKRWAKLPTQLKPSESKTWKIDSIAGILEKQKLKERGWLVLFARASLPASKTALRYDT